MDGKVANGTALDREIAARQYGVVSVMQLRRVGIGDDAVRAECIAGHLHRVHRGVYAVGHVALVAGGSLVGGRAGRGTAARTLAAGPSSSTGEQP